MPGSDEYLREVGAFWDSEAREVAQECAAANAADLRPRLEAALRIVQDYRAKTAGLAYAAAADVIAGRLVDRLASVARGVSP